MSVINDPRWRVLDASGNAIVGATMTVYVAGGTTLASIYSDAALTVPMGNPLSGVNASDASGHFPQVYAAEGASFDITLKDPNGATLPSGSYLSVPAVGALSSSLFRDFTGSRFQARNSGGVVQIETGDPAGDDVGGKARFGGWNGTQGDSASMDYATFDVTGLITEASKKLPGIVYSPGSFSAVSQVDIPLPAYPPNVRHWELDVTELLLSATADINWRVSYDNGSTFRSDSFGYSDTNLAFTGSGASASTSAGASIGRLAASYGGNNVRVFLRGHLRISGPASGVQKNVRITGQVHNDAMAFTLINSIFDGGLVPLSGPITTVRLSVSAGNMTGRYRLIPMRGLGD